MHVIWYPLLLLFSLSVGSNFLQTHGLQHARHPCPSPYPRACSNSMSIESVMPPSHLFLCHPLPLLLSTFPSIRVFSNELAICIRWPKFWSFSFSISPSNEYSGLISFRTHWFDLLAVQRTLKNLLQHHSSKASILQPSALFMVQFSHPYMTTRKSIALTIWTFVSKLMLLHFNMLSRFVITFLPRSKCFYSMAALIFELNKIKSVIVSIVSPMSLPWSDETSCHNLCFF